MRFGLGSTIAAVLIVAAVPVLAQPCPSSTVAVYSTSPVLYPSAAVDSVTPSGRRAAYDLIAGWVAITHTGGVGFLHCEASDRFRVVGVPDGTPVHVIARLAVDGYAQTDGCGGSGCHGEFGGWIGQGASVVSSSVTAHFGPERIALQQTLEYPLDVLAGEWFDLQYRLWFNRTAGASHFGGGRADLRFAGLPDGADIVSCQGYRLTTPARIVSWGRVKTIYR